MLKPLREIFRILLKNTKSKTKQKTLKMTETSQILSNSNIK